MPKTRERQDYQNAWARERRKTHPEFAEKRRAASRAVRNREIEKARADCRAKHAKNRDARLVQKRDYYQRVRKAFDKTDEGRFRDRNRKALRRALAGGAVVTLEEWEAIKADHGNRCAYCPSSGPLEMDHVVPLSKGGIHHKSNIVPACKPCNSRKGAKCG